MTQSSRSRRRCTRGRAFCFRGALSVAVRATTPGSTAEADSLPDQVLRHVHLDDVRGARNVHSGAGGEDDAIARLDDSGIANRIDRVAPRSSTSADSGISEVTPTR